MGSSAVEESHTWESRGRLNFPVPIGGREDRLYDIISIGCCLFSYSEASPEGMLSLLGLTLLGTPALNRAPPVCRWGVLNTRFHDVLLSIACYLYVYFGLLSPNNLT